MKEPKLYIVIKPILSLFIKMYCPTIINNEVIPKKGRVVLAGNHKSNYDPLLLAYYTKRVVHFMAKDELVNGPLGFAFKRVGLIPVNRRQKDHQALETAIDYLNKDLVIGIFPEGTFNKTKDIVMPFKFGAVKMASVTNSYIVPFSITNEYKLFRKSVKITFGSPYKVKENLEIENKRLMDKVSKLIIENRDES